MLLWSGSVHDARIFDNSVVKHRLETRQLNGILLADSGYPCRNYILTPVLQPTLPAQRRYNRSHIATRITVERCFGVLKRRFLCLQQKLRYTSDFRCNILLACVILNNFIIEKEGLSDEELKENVPLNDDFDMEDGDPQGSAYRDVFFQRHFSN